VKEEAVGALAIAIGAAGLFLSPDISPANPTIHVTGTSA
jgi:hypothetical protein